MASYAVTARIDRVPPRLARHDGPRPVGDGPVRVERLRDEPSPVAIDLAPATWERWERIRESWAQMTFFLFDPESWR
jgi:hypothetical protein